MTRALLIYPKTPSLMWNSKEILDVMGKKAPAPPLGILTIASILPKEWDLTFVDLNTEDLSDNQIAHSDLVFISAHTIHKHTLPSLIDRLKNHNKVIIAGGHAFTNEKELYPQIDHFILNEGEQGVQDFLTDLKNDSLQRIYQTHEPMPIQEIPPPRFDLANLDDYMCMNLQITRGCPFTCEFCTIAHLYGNKPRVKSTIQVLRELDNLYQNNYRGVVYIVDDNFLSLRSTTKEILSAIVEWQQNHHYPFLFQTDVSMNLAQETEIMELMVEARFKHIFIGLESSSLDCLKECNKVQNLKLDLLTSIKTLYSYGLQPTAGFILGFDHDTKEAIADHIKFLQESGIVVINLGMLRVIPNTRLWQRLEKEGRLPVAALNKAITPENIIEGFLVNPNMGQDHLIEAYKEMIQKLFSPSHVLDRIRNMVKQCVPSTKKSNHGLGKIKSKQLLIIIKSLINLLLLKPYSPSIWRLLGYTLHKKPSLLVDVLAYCALIPFFQKRSKTIGKLDFKHPNDLLAGS